MRISRVSSGENLWSRSRAGAVAVVVVVVMVVPSHKARSSSKRAAVALSGCRGRRRDRVLLVPGCAWQKNSLKCKGAPCVAGYSLRVGVSEPEGGKYIQGPERRCAGEELDWGGEQFHLQDSWEVKRAVFGIQLYDLGSAFWPALPKKFVMAVCSWMLGTKRGRDLCGSSRYESSRCPGQVT